MTAIGITGHRGLPPETTRLVDEALRDILAGYADDSITGMSSLADGADQLFAQALLDHGGTLEAIVPAQKYREGLPKECWPTYDNLISQAQHVHRLSHIESTEDAHMDASIYMLKRIDLLLAVWDGKAARGYGGTADIVSKAHELGVQTQVVWPPGASRE